MKRFGELDGLRGIAALWVVVYHLTSGPRAFWLKSDLNLASQLTPIKVNLQGLYAVDLFFIISGFVILLTVEKSHMLREFIISRVSRLYPVYWAAVIISTTVGILLPFASYPVTPIMGLVNLTMLQTYVGVREVDPSYWSLAVELGFYAMIALVLATKQLRHIEVLGLFWMLASSGAVLLLPSTNISLPWRVQTALAAEHAPLFFAGILFYKIRSNCGVIINWIGIIWCLLLRLAAVKADLTVLIIECASFLVFALCVLNYLPLLRARSFLFLGAISYSLYVVHQPLGFRLQMGLHSLGVGPWLNLFLTLSLLIAVATILTYLVDRPGHRALQRVLRAYLISDHPASITDSG